MAAVEPERYVAKMTKSIRTGKIFVDYLRNSLEQTAVGAFSTRARPGAPVSATVTWDELGRVKGANQYTVLNIAKRLGSLKRDPWADIGKVKQALPDLQARLPNLKPGQVIVLQYTEAVATAIQMPEKSSQ